MTSSQASPPMSAEQILDREFLQLRAKILELAASFDRLDRAAGAANQERLDRLRRALDILQEARADRAEQVQLLFSREYHPDWKSQFGLDG